MHSPTGCCCTTDRIVWMQSFKYREKSRCKTALFFLYKENHSLGEWFKRRLLPIMRTRKTPFARIEVRSGNCTKKQREVTQNERQ